MQTLPIVGGKADFPGNAPGGRACLEAQRKDRRARPGRPLADFLLPAALALLSVILNSPAPALRVFLACMKDVQYLDACSCHPIDQDVVRVCDYFPCPWYSPRPVQVGVLCCWNDCALQLGKHRACSCGVTLSDIADDFSEVFACGGTPEDWQHGAGSGSVETWPVGCHDLLRAIFFSAASMMAAASLITWSCATLGR